MDGGAAEGKVAEGEARTNWRTRRYSHKTEFLLPEKYVFSAGGLGLCYQKCPLPDTGRRPTAPLHLPQCGRDVGSKNPIVQNFEHYISFGKWMCGCWQRSGWYSGGVRVWTVCVRYQQDAWNTVVTWSTSVAPTTTVIRTLVTAHPSTVDTQALIDWSSRLDDYAVRRLGTHKMSTFPIRGSPNNQVSLQCTVHTHL